MQRKNRGKYLVLALVLMFVGSLNVWADFSAADVANNFTKSKIIDYWNSSVDDYKLSAEIDKTNKKLNILVDGEVIMVLNYTDEYIEYNNKIVKVDDFDYKQVVFVSMNIEGIIETILNLQGYTDKTLVLDKISSLNYDNDGIEVKESHFDYDDKDETGYGTVIDLDYLSYFKMTLNEEKITKLVEKAGADLGDITADGYEFDGVAKIGSFHFESSGTGGAEIELEPDERFINLVPSRLKFSDVTSNSLYVGAVIDNFDSSKYDGDVPLCYMYRSNSRDGEYEKVSLWAVNCADGVSVMDEGLESDTVYYYKAKVVGGEFSDVFVARTLGVESASKDTEELTNPKTGSISFYIAVTAFIVSAVFILVTMRKSEKNQMI